MYVSSGICATLRWEECRIAVNPCGWANETEYERDLVLDHLDLVTYPVLLVISTVGSALTALVLGQERPRTSKCVYLVAGAFFDTVYMWSNLPLYLLENREPLHLSKSWATSTEPASGYFSFLVEASSLMSNLTLVAFSVNRMLAVRSPLKHRIVYNSANKCLFIVGTIILLSLFPFLPPLITEKWCSPRTANVTEYCQDPLDAPPALDVMMTICLFTTVLILPIMIFLLVFAINAILMRTLRLNRQNRLQELEIFIPSNSVPATSDRRALLMLGACVLLYFLCYCPTFLVNCMLLFDVTCVRHLSKEYSYRARPVALLFINMNSSLSFILYCAVDPAFRTALMRRICFK